MSSLRTLALLLMTVAMNAQETLKITYVCDRTGDGLWRLEDLNRDLDYLDSGEVTAFFDAAVGGALLDNVSAIAVGPDGALYVSSLNQETIVRLTDLDGDGTAHGPGETVIVFDGNPGGNASGVQFFSANNLCFDAAGTLWVAHADAGAGGTDAIYRLQDLNLDGDYNDGGEASAYFVVPVSGSNVGDSLPVDLHIGLDGALYYLEASGNGFLAKGIYRLDDLDQSGSIDPLTEVSPFFLPTLPVGATNQFFWGMDQDDVGRWYLADTLNELIYRLDDQDGNGVIDPTEATVIWTAASSNIWMIDVDDTGKIYCAEDQSPDRILTLRDLNGDGLYDPTEALTTYDENFASQNILSPRSLVTVDVPARYAGNGSDAATRVSINGVPSQATSNVHLATGGDVLTLHFESPLGTLNGQGFVALIQSFATGQTPAPLLLGATDPVPSVYLDLAQPIGILVNGLYPTPPVFLVPVLGAWSYVGALPPILSGQGQSFMVEIIVHDLGRNAVNLGNSPSVEIRIL
ncbi:MAG: hypothetical protein KDB53_05315 [Planctomycetes bacterium]|nr:hypothetical protein [Planctomycetota bacterium]